MSRCVQRNHRRRVIRYYRRLKMGQTVREGEWWSVEPKVADFQVIQTGSEINHLRNNSRERWGRVLRTVYNLIEVTSDYPRRGVEAEIMFHVHQGIPEEFSFICSVSCINGSHREWCFSRDVDSTSKRLS
ncbi:hypothetical protein Rs2_10752 [Raphanus sativus]|nr:hypothetical protein Rs2_10752 [Raphanus sativus]